MEETIFIKHLIEKELLKCNVKEEIKSKVEKICHQSYIKGFKDGRYVEQMDFLKQAEYQLGIIKQLKIFLKSSRDFKALNYLEKLEKERK